METEKMETNETHNSYLAFRLIGPMGMTMGNVVLGFNHEEDEQGYQTVKKWLDANKGNLGASSGLIDGGVLADELRPPPEYVGKFLSDEEMTELLGIFKAQAQSAKFGAN